MATIQTTRILASKEEHLRSIIRSAQAGDAVVFDVLPPVACPWLGQGAITARLVVLDPIACIVAGRVEGDRFNTPWTLGDAWDVFCQLPTDAKRFVIMWPL